VNASHAIPVSPTLLAAVRQRGATQARIEALCAGTGPLSGKDKADLEAALDWWARECSHAEMQVRAITLRLDRQ
jgi:hypothetical protein